MTPLHTGSGDPRPPDVIDIEASGFGRGSYPIEVGFVTSEGERYCALVKPAAHWTHWDESAAGVHGISRPSLIDHGRPVAEIGAALNAGLAGRVVYTDAWGYDFTWLAVLFHEAGSGPRFRLEPIQAYCGETDRGKWDRMKADVARELALPRHRASSDALILQQACVRLARARLDTLAV